MNFYAVLGISRDADDEAIRSAYRILARRYHPDRGAGSSAEKFRLVKEAYETLIDSARRRSYDLSLQGAQSPVPVQVEPMVAQSGPFFQEDARLFGRFAAPPPSQVLRTPVDEMFDRWFYSLDDFFFDSEWPW